MSRSRALWIGVVFLGSLLGSGLFIALRPPEALAGGVVKPLFAERIRSWYGVSYFEDGPTFEFTTEQGVSGTILTDLVLSFETSGAHGALVRVNGVTVFEFFEDFLNETVHPTPIHLESGIPVPPGATVSIHHVRAPGPGHRLFVNIMGYTF